MGFIALEAASPDLWDSYDAFSRTEGINQVCQGFGQQQQLLVQECGPHDTRSCPYGLECLLLEVGDMPGALGWAWVVLCLVFSVSMVLGF